MNNRSPAAPARVLQAVVVLAGLGAIAFLLGEPHLEGRNAHATVFEIYFKDPFLAFAYLASLPFFVALVQAFRILGCVARGRASSPEVLKGLGTIKFCALLTIGFVVVGECLLLLNESDDRAGGVFMGLLIASVSAVAAAAATMFERIVLEARP